MRFLTPDEVPIKDLTVYRAFPLSSGIMLVLLTPAIPLLATTGSTNGVLWYVVCLLTLLWLLAANDLRKAFKPTSWLIAIGDKSMFLKWRSYQNVHWGTHDIQIVEIQFTSIASVRAIKRSWQRQDNGEISRSLDLTLRHGISVVALAKYWQTSASAAPAAFQ